MKNTFAKILILITIFLMVLPFNAIWATEDDNVKVGTEELSQNSNKFNETHWDEAIETDSVFEKVISSFCLSFGDYAHDFLAKTFREELTIDKIVFNDSVRLNANFFEKSESKSVTSASNIVREFINNWYDFFRKLALVAIMISVVGAGIKIVLKTPGAKAKAYESLKKIVIATILIFFFPYVMRYAFELNDAIVERIQTENGGGQSIGASISQVSDLLIDDLEFRSPKYISLKGLKVGAGSSEATQLYLNRLEQYASTGDIMRTMRAFAGVTLRFVYVMIWYIMLVQTYMLVVIYVKRYIMIAFLTAIYPLVIIGYVTGAAFGQSQAAFNNWCSKYFSNVFLQAIHAIMYGVISGVLISQVRDVMYQSGATDINWLLMILATSFLFSGEKIIAKFWKAAIDTSERKGMRSILGAPKRMLNFIGH